MLLEVKNLKKHFGSVIASDNINFKMKKDEIIGVIGANGAGKTTFCNIVTGYMQSDAGNIIFKGTDITKMNVNEVQSLGIQRSFQVAQIFNGLTVLENISIALATSRIGKHKLFDKLLNDKSIEEAKKILDRFAIKDTVNLKVSTLPQGIRKVLDIIIAIVGSPSLILLDEPTSGVSSQEKFLIMDKVIMALKEMQVGVLFIEHDMEVVEKYSDRIIAFYEGRIIADGKPSEVLKDKDVVEYVVGKG